MFASIFGSGRARDAYVSARRADPPPEIVFRSASPSPQREVVERRVRVEVREWDAVTAPEQRDRIIEVVVDELMSPEVGQE